MDPNTASSKGLPEPVIVSGGTQLHMAIAFSRRAVPSEVRYTVEVSSDLHQWNAGSWYSDNDEMANTEFTEQHSDAEQTVVRLKEALGGSSSRFLRVQIQAPHIDTN